MGKCIFSGCKRQMPCYNEHIYYYFFGGTPVIQAESLTEKDPTEISIIFDESSREVKEKYRDVLKQCVLMENGMATYLILGIENQTDIHYAMPVRNMIYDSLNYGEQVSRIASQHRNNKDLAGDEFLSGFAREDKIKPVVTLTIYFGSQEWNAPRKLSDMFDTKNQKILEYANDYRLNLIIPSEIKDFSSFSSELKNVLEFIAHSNDKQAIKEIAKDASYQHLQADTVQLINACTSTKIPISKGEKEGNMCKGMDDWAEEIRAEAAEVAGIRASIEAWQEDEVPMEDILSRLEKKYHLTEAAARDYYSQFALQTV